MTELASALASGDVRDRYEELEREIRPTMEYLARKFAPIIGVEQSDAIQEARIAVYNAFQQYDFDRSNGGVRKYAAKVIKNAFLALVYSATTQSRTPHAIVVGDDGEERLVKQRRLASLDELFSSDQGNQWEPMVEDLDLEGDVDRARRRARVVRLRLRLERRLAPRERTIFRLTVRPTEAFLVFLRNIGADDASNVHISRFLGLAKNVVDTSLYKIRGEFRALAEEEFSDLIAELIEENEWPMFEVSKQADDSEFIRRVIRERRLDPRPLNGPRDIFVSDDVGRIVEKYHWGVVLHLRWKEERATVVAIGRFNVPLGILYAEHHSVWKPISDVVPWYAKLAREIRKRLRDDESE